jgi:hypothetical protein
MPSANGHGPKRAILYAGGVSKYENAAGSLPCSYPRRRRRAVGISESVESAEDAFAQ